MYNISMRQNTVYRFIFACDLFLRNSRLLKIANFWRRRHIHTAHHCALAVARTKKINTWSGIYEQFCQFKRSIFGRKMETMFHRRPMIWNLWKMLFFDAWFSVENENRIEIVGRCAFAMIGCKSSTDLVRWLLAFDQRYNEHALKSFKIPALYTDMLWISRVSR